MKRKLTLIFLSIVCALCLCFGLTACGGNSSVDGDKNTEQTGGVDQDGENDDLDDEETPSAHVHNAAYVAQVDATCTQDGNIAYWYCSGCDKYFSDEACTTEIASVVISATGHTLSEAVKENEVAATCTTDGSYDLVVYCSDCGAQISKVTITTPSTGHDWNSGEITTAPTCTAEGVKTYTCTDCGETKTEVIPATGHNYESVVTAPTCTTNGYTTHTCATCGDSYTDSETAAKGHSWNSGAITTAPTCTAEGVKTYTCTDCGETKTEIISATGHNYESVVTDPTCTTNGYTTHTCATCGDSYTDSEIAATGHSWNSSEITTAPTCTADGVKTYTCTDCGETKTEVIPATGHTITHVDKVAATFTDAGNIEYWYCSVCGKYFSDEACANEITLSDTVLAALGSNISAGSDYYEDETTVSYRYSYSITIENDQFLLYILAVGSDDSYSLTYKTGTIVYIGEYDVYRLDYSNGDDSEYIKIDNSGFYFCNADGTKDESKTEIEREGSGETAVDITPRTGNSSYGYYDLAYEANGADMQSLYYQMYTVCEAFTSNTDDVAETDGLYVISYIYLNSYSLTTLEVVSVWKVFYLENPMYYWLSNTCTISGNALYLCVDEEYANYTNRQTYDAEISAMITDACEVVAQESTELEKAMAVHDYIIAKIDYAYQSDGVTPETAIWAHNITGVSSKGYGVCEAYAKTYLALCLINGLNCIIVSGYAGSEAHVWNLVQIDGVWYGVDCTWDDTGTSDVSYTCFGMSASTIASSRKTDRSYEYGIDYLYELPEISGYDIQLVTLYKGDTSLGVFVNIDVAFAAMTDTTADYTIELFSYSYSGVLLLSAPEISHYIYSDYTPAVNSITINGTKTDYGNGYFSTTLLYIESLFMLKCNLEISNINLNAAELDLGEYTLTTSGYYCQINGKIYDNKITETYSINADTTIETEVYATLNINYIYGKTQLRSDAEIGTYKGELRVVGFDSVYAYVIINNYVISNNAEYNGIYLQYGNLKINNLFNEDTNNSNGYVNITLEFGNIEKYPALYLGNINTQIRLGLLGSIYYVITDAGGNIINSWTETADPYNLDCAIATLGNADDFTNVSIYFDWNWINKTSLFGVNENNEIICDVEIVDEYFYVKDGVLVSYTGNESTVVIPDIVTSIGENAFYECTSLKEVIIPSCVTYIGRSAFAGCTALINITIPDYVTTIESYAFSGCTSLISVTIGSSVESIGDWAFNACDKLIEVYNLSSLEIIAGINNYGYVSNYAKIVHTSLDEESILFMQEDYLFFYDNNNYYLISYVGTASELILPTLIDEDNNLINYSIYKYAFAYNTSLTSIDIGNCVTSIGDYAFRKCTSLTSITIPKNVTSIGVYIFFSCTSLVCVTISDGLSIISDNTFYDCALLTTVIISDSVTAIGSDVFWACYYVSSIYYEGTEESWNDVSIDSTNYTYLTSTTIYYYSESEPTDSGNYWHYVDGEVVVWTDAE